MASTEPGTSPHLVKDAHYHAIAATALWKSFIDAMRQVATNTATERERRDASRARATTYARGTLGGH